MFVGGYTGRQYFRDRRVGNDRESPVNGTGGVGIPFVGNETERHRERKHPVFVVDKDFAVIAWLNTAERHCRSRGEAHSKNSGAHVRAKRYQTSRPTDLNAGFDELFRKALAVI